jgi:hypothetical protein
MAPRHGFDKRRKAIQLLSSPRMDPSMSTPLTASRPGLCARCSVTADGSFSQRVSAIACLLLGLVGCAERSVPATTVRDSAGVAIMENEAPLHGGALSVLLTERPLIDLGGADATPGEQFEEIIDAAQTPDQGFVVADRGRRQLLFYDASGEHRATAGGPGQGPGEFQDIGGLGVRGDSILAYDWRQARLSIFDMDGALLETVQLSPTPDELHPIQFYNMVGVLGAELLVAPLMILPPRRAAPGPYWDSAAVYVYRLDGGRSRAVGEGYRTELFVGTQGVSSRPFGARTSIVTDGSHVIMGTGQTYELRVYDAVGALTRIIRRDWIPRPVTPAATDSLLEHMIRAVGATSRTDPRYQGYVRTIESALAPDHMPAFSGLLTDPRGNLWVRRYAAEYEEGPREWSIFDRDGSWLGNALTPDRFEALAIGTDVILGVWRDPFDVHHFQAYGLSWSALQPGAQ